MPRKIVYEHEHEHDEPSTGDLWDSVVDRPLRASARPSAPTVLPE
jgi:hypothetical protein